MEAYFTKALGYLGTLGLGGVIGVYAKSWFDYRLKKNQILLEARVKAYSNIVSKILNKAMDPEVFTVPEPLKFVTVNKVFSEASLLAGPVLTELLGAFIPIVCEYHAALNQNDDVKGRELHEKLDVLARKMCSEMRKELMI